LPTYAAAKKWFKKLNADVKLEGFKEGLTHLQFLNNLVALGMCQPPSVGQMAEFVDEHHDKGAYIGLQVLGFRLDGRPTNWVQAALQCVYDHLDATLAPEDRKLLIFGTIFLEHVLCKVVRFKRIIEREAAGKSKNTSLSLEYIGMKAAEWQPVSGSGANGKALLFPAWGNCARMEASVKQWA
jgi:hypothetical protein